MAEIVIFDWDLSKAFRQMPQMIPVPSLPVKVVLTPHPRIEQAVGRDPLLHQRIVDACKRVFDQAAANINAQLISADMQLAGASPAKAKSIVDGFNESARSRLRSAETEASRKAAEILAQLKAQRAEYRNYQIQCGVKVGFGALGVGVAAAGIAGAAWTGGASLAIAIVVATRSIVEGAKTLNNLCREAETIGKRVAAAVSNLAQRHGKGSSRAGATVKEMMGTVAGAVFVWDFNALKNIPKAKADCDLWKNKLFGIRGTAHDLAQQLNTVLELCSDLDRQLLNPRPGSKEAKLKAAAEKYRIEVMGLLGEGLVAEARAQSGARGQWARLTTSSSISHEHLRAEVGLKAQEAAGHMLDELEKKSPGWVKYFDQFFPIAVNLGLGYSTAGAPESMLDAVTLGVGIGADIGGLAYEALDMAGFFSLGEEIGQLASGDGPQAPEISAPTLVSTTANLTAMKLQPIGAPPRPSSKPLPPTPSNTPPLRPLRPPPPPPGGRLQTGASKPLPPPPVPPRKPR